VIKLTSYLEEIIQSVLRRQEVTTDAQTFIQQAQSGNLIFIFDGLDEKLVHYTKERFTFGGHLREFCGTRLMVFFKVSFIQARAYFVCLLEYSPIQCIVGIQKLK
jgi:hypothetical protein